MQQTPTKGQSDMQQQSPPVASTSSQEVGTQMDASPDQSVKDEKSGVGCIKDQRILIPGWAIWNIIVQLIRKVHIFIVLNKI